MKLIQYRDPESPDYIYFWVVDGHQVSPTFNDDESAKIWASEQIDPWDNWKSNKDIA